MTFLDHGIAVTDAARFDLNPNCTGPGLGNWPLGKVKGSPALTNLGGSHCGH
jgi:hypothetical protein